MSWLLAGVMVLVVTGFARPAAAQDTPKAEVSVGYQWLAAKSSGDDEWTKFPKGFYVDVAGNVSDTLSIVGQYSWNSKHDDDELIDIKAQTFMAGVRGSSPGRVRGYGQILVGGAQVKASNDDFDFSVSETDFALQLGGGVNLISSASVGFRVGVDYLRIFAKEDGEALEGSDVNGFRFIAGVTFGIGNR